MQKFVRRFDEVVDKVAALKRANQHREAEKLLNRNIEKYPRELIFHNLLLSCVFEVEKAWPIFERMCCSGISPDVVSYTLLINLLGKFGQCEKAIVIFKNMRKQGVARNVKIYNTLISHLGKNGDLEKAWNLYEEMLEEGIEPDFVLRSTLFSVFGKGGQIDRVWNIYENSLNGENILDITMFSTMIDVLGRNDDLTRAWEVYEKMIQYGFTPDEITLSSLISGFYRLGRYAEIIEKLNPMELPLGALTVYCDALRKNRQYANSVYWCDYIIENAKDADEREYAWVIKLYCLLHFRRKHFESTISMFTVAKTSKSYARYLAVKVFGDAVLPEEKENMITEIVELMKKDRSEASMKDLENALGILRYKS